NPLLRRAVSTRVRASLQAWSGIPEGWNPGKPNARSTWTSTGRAPAPAMVALCRVDCTAHTHCERRAGHAPERTQADPSQNRTSILDETAQSGRRATRAGRSRRANFVRVPEIPLPPPAAARDVRGEEDQEE